MKKSLLFIAILAVIVVAGFGANAAFAQSTRQGETPPLNGLHGRGSGSAMGGQVLRPYMESAVAQVLGISVEALQTARADGMTLWQIAEEQGFTLVETQELFAQATSMALADAVSDGAITQDLADALQAHFDQLNANGLRQGLCDGSGTGYMQGGMHAGDRGRHGGGNYSQP